ncbi:MAG: response regulator [Fimbriimonadaceae bacterium]|nr:response regulator [Fimbriimonadaceae bacterium]
MVVWSVTAALVLALLAAATSILGLPAAATRGLLVTVSATLALLAVTLAAIRVNSCGRPVRAAWALLAAGLGGWVVAEAAGWLQQQLAPLEAAVDLRQWLLWPSGLAFAAGLRRLAAAHAAPGTGRAVLDAAVAVVATVGALGPLALGPLLAQPTPLWWPLLGSGLTLLVAAAGIAWLTACFLPLIDHPRARAWGLLASGSAAWLLSLTLSGGGDRGPAVDTWVSGGLVVAAIAFLLAGVSEATSHPCALAEGSWCRAQYRPRQLLSANIPLLWAVVAYLWLCFGYDHPEHLHTGWTEGVVGLLLLLVALRQVAGARENERLFGEATAELTRREQTEAALRQTTEDLEQRVLDRTSALEEANRTLRAEVTQRRDAQYETQQIGEQLRDANLRLEGALADLHETQQQVIQQERLRALGTMASGIAHDFNNALAPILGFSEVLLAHPEARAEDDKLCRYLTMISTCAQDAAGVVSRLREFYRHRGEEEELQPVDVIEVVGQAAELAQPRWKNEAQAGGVTIEMALDLPADLPIVYGNPAELREALLNLVFNAADAILMRGAGNRSGLITLRAAEVGEQVVVSIIDNGVGMTEETRQRCLEPFYSTKGEAGTGLGLAMVYGIVQRHHGQIELTNQWMHGTTFRLLLPAAGSGGDHLTLPNPEPLHRQLSVLAVDDEPHIRRIIQEYLETDGHGVTLAGNGRQALELLRSRRYDLVLTDRAMPGMNGDQVATVATRLWPGTAVIMLTGFGDMMIADDEIPPGVDLVLSKPLTLDTLRGGLLRVAGE